MVKAVIFDVDGTLVDSVDLHAKAWQEALAHFGYQVPFDAVRSQIGKGGDQLIPVFLSTAELEAYGEDLEAFRSKLWKSTYMQHVKAFPRVRELFLALKNRGIRIALASSAKGDELGFYKEVTGIADLVEGETSSSDAEKSKPHPDIFEAALEKLALKAGPEVIVIGDTQYDVIAAKRAGLQTIGVRGGGFPDALLLEHGAIAIFDGPADLLEHLDQSPLAAKR